MSGEEQRMPALWEIWRNPIVWRYAQSRLRWKRTLFWALLILILSAFCSLMAYLPATQRDLAEPGMAARWILPPVLIIQGIVLLLMGTGSVASGIVDERLSGGLDYQRMAPLSPAHKIIGYLFGLPIREYLLFLLPMPFVLFGVIRGGIPLQKVAIVYLLFWTSALLYHLTALVAGMVTKRWRLASRLTQMAIILLYVLLPQLSQLNIFIFESLTVRPAVAEHLGPYLAAAGWDAQAGPPEALQRFVPVFQYSVPHTWFALFLQAALMALFFVMLLRKWVQDHVHPLNKLQALVVLVFFELLLFANLWPVFTTTELTGEVQARFPLPIPAEAVSAAISTIVVLLSGALGYWLVIVMTPNWQAVSRGWCRARRQGRTRVPWTWDEAGAFAAVAVVSAVIAGGVVLVLCLLQGAGYFEFAEGGWMDRTPAALALGGSLFVFGSALACWEGGRTMIAILLVGMLPVLAAIVFASVDESAFANPAFFVASVSPLGTLILALVQPNIPPNELAELRMMRPAIWSGFAWMLFYAVALVRLWQRKEAELKRTPG